MEDIHTCKSYRDNSSCFWRRSFAEEEEEAEDTCRGIIPVFGRFLAVSPGIDFSYLVESAGKA